MTNEQMAMAFNEWMRRFVDDPSQFEREFEAVGEFLKDQNEGREPSYGEQCAAYMSTLAAEATN